MKEFVASVLLTFIVAVPAFAQDFVPGPLLLETSDGGKSSVFSFVSCNGGLMLDFNRDSKLNKFRKTNDGGYLVKYNKGKYQLTFYPGGVARNKSGKPLQWENASQADVVRFLVSEAGMSSKEAKAYAKKRASSAMSKC